MTDPQHPPQGDDPPTPQPPQEAPGDNAFPAAAPPGPQGPLPHASPPPPPPKLAIASYTGEGPSCGARRDASLAVNLPGGLALLAVATGVGGEGLGDDCARLAVDTLHTVLAQAAPANELQARQALRRAFAQAHQALKGQVGDQPLRAGAALTAAVLVPPLVVVGHFGDTAAFVAQQRRLVRVSPPHLERLDPVPGQTVVRLAGRLLGHDPRAMVEITVSQLAPGEGVLLVSPPLVGALQDKSLRRLFLSPLRAHELTQRLVQAATARQPGAQATAVTAFYGANTLSLEEAPPMPRWQQWVVAGLLLAAAGAAAKTALRPPALAPPTTGLLTSAEPVSRFVDLYTTPPGAAITWQGRGLGQLTPHRLRLGRTGGEVVVSKTGYAPQRLWLEPGHDSVVRLRLRKLPAPPQVAASASAALSASQPGSLAVVITTPAPALQIKMDRGEWRTVAVGEGGGGRFYWTLPPGRHALTVRSGASEFFRFVTVPSADEIHWFIPAPPNRPAVGAPVSSGSAPTLHR